MTLALRIPVDGPIDVFDFNPDNPTQWQRLVGDRLGVDFITMREHGQQVVVGDVSLLDGKPYNPRASAYVHQTGRTAVMVHGTALLIGVGPSGDTTDVTAEAMMGALLNALTHPTDPTAN